MVAAALTLHGVDLLAEGFQLLLRQHGAVCVFARAGFAVQRCAERAHKPRNIRADDVDAHFFFKGAQHRFIIKGTTLHNDVAPEFFGTGGADDLVQRVLDHRDGKTCADIFNRCTVLLRLLDRGIHKHGAAAAKVNGLVGKKTQRGKFLDVIAQRLCKGLQKAAAAGGTGFVEEDVADGAVLNFKALHILPADVDDKINVGQKVLSGCKVRHRFDQTAVAVEGVFDQFLAVAGRGHAGDLQTGMLLVELEQRFAHQRNGVAEVGAVAGEQNVGVLVNDHQLDGRRAGVNADMYGTAVRTKRYAGYRGFQVAGVERLVLLLVGKQRRQADVGGGGAVLIQTPGNDVQVGFLVGIVGSAQRHKQQAVFGAGAGNAQRFVKALAQRLGEGQRTAQIQDVAADGTPLRQARNGLVDHGLVDGGGDVPCLCALVDQRLDVAFGKHAAAAGDGVGAGRLLGGFVHLVRAHF